MHKHRVDFNHFTAQVTIAKLMTICYSIGTASLVVLLQLSNIWSLVSLSNTTSLTANHSNQSNYGNQVKLNASKLSVGIIGAGISGLYAALLLQDLGIEYEILEASNRIGGRIYTHYFDSKSKYEYVDLGAMRFPKVPIYDRLIGKQNWSLISYLNRQLKRKHKIKLIDFVNKHENNVFYFNSLRKFRSEFEKNGDLFGFAKKDGGFIDEKYTDKNAHIWYHKPFEFIANKFEGNFSCLLRYLLRNDYQTFRTWLMNSNNTDFGYPSEVVDWIETFIPETGAFSLSFMDTYLSNQFPEDYLTVEGGYSKVIQAMASLLKEKPKLNHRVIGLHQKRNKNIIVQVNGSSHEYSHVIATPQLCVLRRLHFNLKINLKKRIAMRAINYYPAVKIGLLFKSRFWENSSLMNGKPIFGGATLTDLMIRQTMYPSYGINCSDCKGAILVSYTWAKDAMMFTPLSESEIVDITLRDLSKIHGSMVYDLFTRKFAIMDWTKNPMSHGAYAIFDPSHYESLYPALIESDAFGRLHFAGDTLSLYHGWSIGALNSAYRAVNDILNVEGLRNKINELKLKWGKHVEYNLTKIQSY